jgi:hypothetical protein
MTPYNSKRSAIIAALPGTIQQLMKRANTSRPTAFDWIRRLRAEDATSESKVYIKKWKRTQGQLSPLYALGNLPDAPKPARMSQSEYHRRTYLKTRQAVEKEARAVRKLARQNADRMAQTRNPWFGALPGARAVSMSGEG